MKKYLFFIIALILSCYVMGQDSNNVKQKVTTSLFQRIENEINKNQIFEDPLGRISYLFKVIKEVALIFLSDTKSYKFELLNLLIDFSFQKNIYTDLDIIYILYNLQIDDYVDILDCALTLYRQDDIDQNVFESFIFQDFNVSNSVAKNYRNEKLQVFFDNLLKDKGLISKIELQNKTFQQAIWDLKSGTIWNGTGNSSGQKDLNKIQSPILDTLK